MQTTRIRLKTETPMIYLIIKLFTNALPWHKNFSCLVWSVSSDSSVKCWSKMHRISIWRHSVHRNISRKCCCKDGDFFPLLFFSFSFKNLLSYDFNSTSSSIHTSHLLSPSLQSQGNEPRQSDLLSASQPAVCNSRHVAAYWRQGAQHRPGNEGAPPPFQKV